MGKAADFGLEPMPQKPCPKCFKFGGLIKWRAHHIVHCTNCNNDILDFGEGLCAKRYDWNTGYMEAKYNIPYLKFLKDLGQYSPLSWQP